MSWKRREVPPYFLGQHEAQLSARGSFRLPAAYRRKLLAEGEGKRELYFFRMEEVLCIFSAAALSERMRQIADTRESGVARYLWAQAAVVEIPRAPAGQVAIPPRVLEASGLTPGSKLTLLGVQDHIEIWPEQAWDAEMQLWDENIRM